MNTLSALVVSLNNVAACGGWGAVAVANSNSVAGLDGPLFAAVVVKSIDVRVEDLQLDAVAVALVHEPDCTVIELDQTQVRLVGFDWAAGAFEIAWAGPG